MARVVSDGEFLFSAEYNALVAGLAGDAVLEGADVVVASDGWDVSKATFLQSLNIGAQDLVLSGVFFRSDGLKMYAVGTQNDSVYEYDLGTAWNISTATFLQSFSVAAQDDLPTDVFFRSDGLKMYVVGASISDSIHEYDLSSAWDISTAALLQSFSVSTQDATPTGVFFRSDGLKMYVIGDANDSVYEYDLGTAWNISTATFLQSFSVAAQDDRPEGIFLRSDGLKMYAVGTQNDSVYEYDLGTAWNISTATFLQSFSFTTEDNNPRGIFLRSDGLKMYVAGDENNNIYEYDLEFSIEVASKGTIFKANITILQSQTTLEFNLSNLQHSQFLQSFSVAAQDTNPGGVFFRSDGLKMYVVGSQVYEYDLGTAWNISTATFLQSFSVAAQDLTPEDLFFRSDGLKMYVVGFQNDSIYEYDLGTAWNISTATFLQSFSVAAQDTFPHGLFFRSDGLKMYITGTSSDSVHEYDLGTAWNISTATFLQSLSISAQDGLPHGVFFRDNGFKMYVVGDQNNSVYEYNLDTAWDISTATFLQSFSLTAQDTFTQGLFFRSDGLKLYIAGTQNDSIYEYDTFLSANRFDLVTTQPTGTAPTLQDEQPLPAINPRGLYMRSDGQRAYTVDNATSAPRVLQEYVLGRAWDIRSAQTGSSFDVNAQDTSPGGIFFSPDGVNVYHCGSLNDSVYQYTLATPWNLNTATFLQSLSVTAQETGPGVIFFKPDGKTMYVVGGLDTVFQYTLTTPWDISTASYTGKSFNMNAQEASVQDIWFNTDGTRLLMTGFISDQIHDYTLSTAWDVSTASLTTSHALDAANTDAAGIATDPDELRVFIIDAGGSTESIYAYHLAEAVPRVTEGTPAVTALAPAAPVGDVILAVVRIDAGTTVIGSQDITDVRMIRRLT